MLFKVLGLQGEAIHGGSGEWPLPEGDQPGEWLSVTGTIRACINGLHLTPAHALMSWYRKESRLFVAEADTTDMHMEDSSKAAFRRARLLTEVTAEWPLLKLFPQTWVYIAIRDSKENSRANLSGANLYGANLYGANLYGANLHGADLGEWERDESTGYARRKVA